MPELLQLSQMKNALKTFLGEKIVNIHAFCDPHREQKLPAVGGSWGFTMCCAPLKLLLALSLGPVDELFQTLSRVGGAGAPVASLAWLWVTLIRGSR